MFTLRVPGTFSAKCPRRQEGEFLNLGFGGTIKGAQKLLRGLQQEAQVLKGKTHPHNVDNAGTDGGRDQLHQDGQEDIRKDPFHGQFAHFWPVSAVRMTPCPHRLQPLWTGGILTGEMTIWRDKCLAKVVPTVVIHAGGKSSWQILLFASCKPANVLSNR